MFTIWYTNLKQFLKEIPMDATVYHAILHTTTGRSQYTTTKTVALHLRAFDRDINTLHLLAISAGRYETVNGRPFDDDHYQTVTARADALRTHVLAIVEPGYPLVEAVPAVPLDIETLYGDRPEDFHFQAQTTS